MRSGLPGYQAYRGGTREPRGLFEQPERLSDLLRRRPCGIVMDVDGTISEIAPCPSAAFVPETIGGYLGGLVKRFELVALLSGRPAGEVKRLVDVDGVVYLGNHGLEQLVEGRYGLYPGARRYAERMARVIGELGAVLLLEGVLFENKGVTVAIHYRQAREPLRARSAILAAIARCAAARTLRVSEGKMVVELRPPLEQDKGRALAGLVRDYQLAGVLYLGDDLTDLDAFACLRRLRIAGRIDGLAVAVLGAESPAELVEAADASLGGVRDVERFLCWLAGDAAALAS